MFGVVVNDVVTDKDDNTEDAILVDDYDAAAEAHRDEQLRELEATRAKRKRRGQPLSLPSEEMHSREPARATRPAQPLHQDSETTAWYSPFPSAGPTGSAPSPTDQAAAVSARRCAGATWPNPFESVDGGGSDRSNDTLGFPPIWELE
jgi:hypothetical protein